MAAASDAWVDQSTLYPVDALPLFYRTLYPVHTVPAAVRVVALGWFVHVDGNRFGRSVVGGVLS